jgi:Zn-dependent membrane protease YugP
MFSPFSMMGMVFLLPLYIFAMFMQFNVKSTFKKYAQVRAYRGSTGAEVARSILDRNGLNDVRIEQVAGSLTDHYDPRSNVIRLSESVYHDQSIAAISVAAHEVGHAIQYAEGYAPIKVRNTVLPLANIGSQSIGLLIFAAFIFRSSLMIDIGILFYLFAIIFHIVTLPVEFNASSRAITQLTEGYYIDEEEKKSAKKVLGAAAMTYVAAAAIAVGELVRLVLYRTMMRDDD